MRSDGVDRPQFSLDRRRVDALPREVLVQELRKVAEQLGGRRFSRRDFDRHATTCKGSAVLAHFGTWAAALNAIGIPLANHRPDRKQITDVQLLTELARLWRKLGHRPSKLEWEASNAAYSYTTYKQRFGGWINACAALVGGAVESAPAIATAATTDVGPLHQPVAKVPPERIHTVPLKLRLRVLTRDQFRCVLCGRTPALNPGAVLHVDHIVPFSSDGPTTEANLRTLCERCNWGKGADAGHAV
jgi:5-methylcytosine-specific restriction endonuclease McrA